MKYIHLVDKMTKCQKHIKEGIEKDLGFDALPEDLQRKLKDADAWLKEADVKLGSAEVPEMAPNIDPMLDYANALNLYSDMFDEKVKSKITELSELIESLYEEVKE